MYCAISQYPPQGAILDMTVYAWVKMLHHRLDKLKLCSKTNYNITLRLLHGVALRLYKPIHVM